MIIQTYNPIKEESSFTNKFLPILPIPKEGEEIILYAERSGERLLLTKNKVTPWQIYRGGYNKKIIINTRPYDIQFKNEFSTRDIGINFVIEVQAKVKVNDPESIWENEIRDMADVMENRMRTYIRRTALQYDFTQYINLQDELEEHFKEQYLKNEDSDIKVISISCNVAMEEEYGEIYRKKIMRK